MSYRAIKRDFAHIVEQAKRVPSPGSPVTTYRKTYQLDALEAPASEVEMKDLSKNGVPPPPPPTDIAAASSSNANATGAPHSIVKENVVEKLSKHIKKYNRRRLRLAHVPADGTHLLEWGLADGDPKKAINQIMLTDACFVQLKESQEESNIFTLATPHDGTLQFKAESNSDAADWVARLSTACGKRSTL
jgi:hypothetical protein